MILVKLRKSIFIESESSLKGLSVTKHYAWLFVVVDSVVVCFAEWPAMYHCIVLVQSLLASCLTYWEVDRKTSAAFSPAQLEMTLKVLQLVKKVFHQILASLSLWGSPISTTFFNLLNGFLYIYYLVHPVKQDFIYLLTCSSC